ncbi:MAG: alpha/beta fold hydrolase [Actinomycetales bacterium]
MTELLDGPDGGRIEILRTGSGQPVTVFGHGIAASIAQTRPFGSGVQGTRVYLHFPGHGASTAPAPSTAPWSYAALAGDLRTVADHTGATRALGVSMGAHALLSLLASTPDRFERLAFVIPAALDSPSPSEHGGEMADLVERRDVESLARMLVAGQPAAVRDLPAVRVWARRHATEIAGTALATALRAVPAQVPLPGGVDALRAVAAPSLVIAQEGDDLHPVAVAVRLAETLPNARLEVLPPGGVLWRDRNRLRELVSGHFNATSDL